jgi:hypothetical protein
MAFAHPGWDRLEISDPAIGDPLRPKIEAITDPPECRLDGA